MALRKPSPVAPTTSLNGVDDSLFALEHPTLWEWLVTPCWEDGSSRLLPSLTIFVENATLKVCLNDKACQRVCFLTSTSIEGLLSEAESALLAGTLDWRASKTTGKKS